MTTISNDLIEAYVGMFGDKEDRNYDARTPEEHIMSHSPKERLEVYLEWNGILGYSSRIWEITQGEL